MAIATATAILGAAALATAGSVYASSRAASSQAKSLREAGRHEEAYQMELLAMQRQLFEEAEPYRTALLGAGEEAVGLLGEDVLREPGTGPLFQRGLTRGFENITAQQALYGLGPGASETQTALGEFTGLLTAADFERIQSARFRLAGLPGPGQQTGQALGLTPSIGASVARQGQLTQAGGAVQAGLYGSYAQTLGQIPGLIAGFGGFGGGGIQPTGTGPIRYV